MARSLVIHPDDSSRRFLGVRPPQQKIGFGTEIGIDGDENGSNFSARAYIIEVG